MYISVTRIQSCDNVKSARAAATVCVLSKLERAAVMVSSSVKSPLPLEMNGTSVLERDHGADRLVCATHVAAVRAGTTLMSCNATEAGGS